MKVEFIVLDHGEKYPEDAGNVVPDKERFDSGGRWLAQQVAEWAHHNCGGWEWTYPLTFEIYVDGEKEGTYEIEREAVPMFTAKKKS